MSSHFKKIASLLFFILIINLSFSQENISPLNNSFQEYISAKNNSPFNTQWISAGPVLNSARVEAVQADPHAPGTMYVAFGSGNLWKTINNGITWQPIFENMPALGIGDIALAPSDPKIIYVGTGESLRKNRNFTMPGNGLYRSDDGGETWQHLGLENSWHIGEIAVHPENPEIVFVAVMGKFWSPGNAKGLYRTIDGGKNWKRVLFVDENTRANDVVISEKNPNIIYASFWENNLDSVLNQSVYGPKSGIYKSEDGGDNWQKINNGLPTEPKIGRIGLAVSFRNPEKVYALIDNRNNKRAAAAEIYKTENGGAFWEKTHADTLRIFPGIGWYFADIYVNPKNDEEIYGLGVRMAHSEDGGKTFKLIGGHVEHLHPSPAQTLHLDHCEMWVNPLNTSHLLLGNDGGIYVTYDKGENWLHLNNIPAGEFYDIAVDNQQPYLIYGGTQDDATAFGPAREFNPQLKDPWKYLWIDAWSGGDGCVTQVDSDDPNTVYFSMQNGYMLRRDMAADTSKAVTPKRLDEFEKILKYNFITPYFISPHDAQTIYHGGNYLMKTTDRGDTWIKISGDLSVSKYPEKKSISAGAIAGSKLQKGLLYVGTDHGAFWCSNDDGKTWEENSVGLPNNYIRSICPSRFKAARVYMAMTGINYDDLNKYLFISENFGKTWTDISANLPNEPVNVILEDAVYENILYAGCYRGVYISMDRGLTWHLFGNNLPAVSIGDLEIQERENDLVVGTHGRGIYFVNLNPIHALYKLGFPFSKNHLFKIPDGQFPKKRDTHHDIDKSTLSKISISFWLARDETVEFFILNKKEEIVFEEKYDAKTGLNQFRWDMVVKREGSDRPYFVFYEKYISPGEYKFKIKTAAGIMEEKFLINKWGY